MVFDRMSDFVTPAADGTSRLRLLGRRAVLAAVALGLSVGLAFSVAAAVRPLSVFLFIEKM
jgi:hypothetical protein